MTTPGTLDTSFGTNGKIAVNATNPIATIVQPDGKTIALSQGTGISIQRFNTDSSLDTNFGSGGTISASFEAGGQVAGIRRMDDGSILLIRPMPATSADGFYKPVKVTKYNSSGVLDTSFGTNGSITSVTSFYGFFDSFQSVLTIGNKIIIGGAVNFSNPPATLEFYNSNGTLDNTFGTNGLVTGLGRSHGGITAALQQSDGKILVAGSAGVYRLLANGTIDSTFTVSAGSSSGYEAQIFQQSDGKIIVNMGRGFIFRLNQNGGTDSTFTRITNANVITLQSGDKILTGTEGVDFQIRRYSKNGVLDTTFGTNGLVSIDFGGYDVIKQFNITPDGHLFASGIDASGKVLSASILTGGANEVPLLAKAIADQSTTIGSAFSFVIPADTFNDPDATAGSTLAYKATLANGNPLPAWLTFDASTRTFSGTPPKGDPIAVKVTATDNGGLSVTDEFNIASFPPIVDAKILKPTKTFSIGGSLYAFTSRGAYIDNDKVGLWKFNSSTNEFEKFTSPLQTANSTIGNVVAVGNTLYLLGTDNAGAFAYLGKLDTTTGNFSLINNVPAAVILPNLLPTDSTLYFAGYTREHGQELWKVDESTDNPVRITDINPGRESSNPGNPGGLIKFGDNVYFSAGNITSGTELWKLDPAGNLTQFDLSVNAGSSIPENFTDIGGTLYFTTYNGSSNSIGVRDLWRINATGQPEKVAENISPRDDGKYFTSINGVVYFNRGFSRNLDLTLWQVSSATGTETQVKADGVSMQQVYSVGSNTYFTGLSPLPAGGVGQILWKRNPTNGNLARLTDSLGTQSSSYDLFSFTDVNGITYFKKPGNLGQELWKIGKDNVLSKVTLPAGNTFNTATSSMKSIEGKLYFVASNNSSTVDLVVQALDPATDRIETVANITATQPTLELEIVGYENGRIFISGRDTTNNAVQQPMLWSIAAEKGTLPNEPTNQAPLLANPIPTVYVNGGDRLSYILPANTFSDPDANDILTYSATLKDGSPLPAGLTFDPATRTFQGTLDRNLSLKVTATDRGGLKASTDFDVRLNNSPVIGALFYGDLREVSTLANKNFQAVLDQNISDPDGDTVTVSASLADGSPLPTWLTFDPTNLRFNGTPATKNIGQLNIRITATDPGRLSSSKDFTLNIKTDRPSVKISGAPSFVYEDSDKPTIDLTRDGSLDAPLTVKYSLGGTATAGVDYDDKITYSQTVFNLKKSAVNNTVTFEAGVDKVTISIPTIDDNIYEGKTRETIVFKLEGDVAYDLGTTNIERTIQIIDNEILPVVFVSTPGMELDKGSAYKLGITEGNSGENPTIEFTAKLSNPSYESVSVDYNIQNVTTSNDDYTPASGTIAFAHGETEKKVSIEVIRDGKFESDEQFQVIFNNPKGDTIINDPAGSGKQVLFNINIANDDKRPTVKIAANKNASEAGEIGEFVITRDNININEELTVKLKMLTSKDFFTILDALRNVGRTSVSAATPGEDYEGSLPTSITFAPGESKITLQVKPIDDLVLEDNQEVVLSIVDDSSYTMGNPNASLRIIDNEIGPAALTRVKKTAAEAGYKISNLSTAEGIISIPPLYQIADGNKVLWTEGSAFSSSLWFFDGKEKKKLDSEVLPHSIELGKNGAAWTRFATENIGGFNVPVQHLFFFDGSTTIDLGKAARGGDKPFDMAGDRIAYTADNQVKIYNIKTKETTIIANTSSIILDPIGNGAAWYEEDGIKLSDGNKIVTLTSIKGGMVALSSGRILSTTNRYADNRTDLYLYDGSKTIGIAEGVEIGSAGIEGDRIYYRVILDNANLPDGTTTPLTAIRNYYISTGKTETIIDRKGINDLGSLSSSGQYTVFNSNIGTLVEDGTNIIEGISGSRPIVAADGSVVFAGYDAANNRSALYLASKDTQFTQTNQATDPAGLNVNNDFSVNVANVNDAPTVTNHLTNQPAEQGKAFTYTIPANTFNDPDGDNLTYNATLADGNPLPSWLTFNATTRTFSGTPTNSSVGNLNLRVTATDPAGLKVNSDFSVNIANVNDAPIVVNPLVTQSTSVGSPTDVVNYIVPANTFSDPDGDNLTYSAMLTNGDPLPRWLKFDPATRTFTGEQLIYQSIDRINLRVKATDPFGLSAFSDFNLNRTPYVGTGNPVVGPYYFSNKSFTLLQSNLFKEMDSNDVLSYTVTLANGDPLPSWLTYTLRNSPGITMPNFLFSGTPNFANAGLHNLRIKATDLAGASTSHELLINISDIRQVSTDASVASFSVEPSISYDGRYLVYNSSGTILLHDRDTNTNSRISPGGIKPYISSNGRYVTYTSSATNLVAGDTNNQSDVFLFDRDTNTTTRVSLSANGTQSDNFSTNGVVSDDGRYVAYHSVTPLWFSSSTWYPYRPDLFLYDRTTNKTKQISSDTGYPTASAIASDGSFVVYGFVPHGKAEQGLYLYDVAKGTNTLISPADFGKTNISPAHISADNRYITYSNGLKTFKYDRTTGTNTIGDPSLVSNLFYGNKNHGLVATNANQDGIDDLNIIDILGLEDNRDKTGSLKSGDGSYQVQVATNAEKLIPEMIGDLPHIFLSPTKSSASFPIAGVRSERNLFLTDSNAKGFSIKPLQQKVDRKVSEIALFAVDDVNGRIGNTYRNDSNYTQAVLDRAIPIFSTLQGSFFSRNNSREVNLEPNKIYEAIEITDGTIAEAKYQLANGKTPTNILFSLPDANGKTGLQISGNVGGYQVAVNNPSQDSLVLNVLPLTGSIVNTPIGAKFQTAPEGRTIDLRDYNGQNLKMDLTAKSSAIYDNQIGFYAVKDAEGAIELNDGTLLKPSDTNYAVEAVKIALLNAAMQANKTDSKSGASVAGGSLYAPVAIAKGTLNDFVTKNPANGGDGQQIHAYFNYIGANPDKIDHFRLLGNNTFGVEDMYGGGDRDFNDMVVKMDFSL